MKIQICGGTGVGPTELAAFDQSLVKAGVANYNLIYLSSVLPPRSDIRLAAKGAVKLKIDWGDRLYVVMAQQRTSRRNQEAWAGLGWMQDPDTLQGLVVEHEGHSKAEVQADIEQSLLAMAENREMSFNPPQMHIVGIKCTSKPVCALVVAVFEASTWRSLRLKDVKFGNRLARLPGRS